MVPPNGLVQSCAAPIVGGDYAGQLPHSFHLRIKYSFEEYRSSFNTVDCALFENIIVRNRY